MAYDINWHVSPGDPVLQHPVYQRFSSTTFGSLDVDDVKNAINAALADDQSAAVVAYCCWLLRVKALLV